MQPKMGTSLGVECFSEEFLDYCLLCSQKARDELSTCQYLLRDQKVKQCIK